MSGPQGEACRACMILLPETGLLIADCLLVGTSSGLRCQWVMDDATQVFMHSCTFKFKFEFKLRAKGSELHRARADREGHPVLLVMPRMK